MSISASGVPELTVAVAEPAPLVAMKLQSIMNRGAAKEGTDLLDIVRLTLDSIAGPVLLEQLANADEQLRADAELHARRWIAEYVDRSFRRVQAVPEGRGTELDDLRLVGELLRGACSAT